MTVTQVLWMQAETYQASDARLAQTAMLGPSTASTTSLTRPGGVIPGFAGELAVTQTSTASLTVNIAAGAASVPSTSSTGGNYLLVNDAPMTVTHAAATSQARVDLILARVYDLGTSSSNGQIEIYPGTAGQGIPSMPAGANAIKLAEVTVGPTPTNVVSQGNISTANRLWAVGAGGIQPIAGTSNRPTNPYDGMACWNRGTASLDVYSATGSAWRSISTDVSGAWTTYTPTWTSTASNPVNGGNGTLTGRYIKFGKTVHFSIHLIVSNVAPFNAGSGSYRLSLPPGLPVGAGRFVAQAYFFDNDGPTVSRKHWPGVALLETGAVNTGDILLATGDPTGSDDSAKGGPWGALVPNGNGNESQDTMTVTGTYETSA